MRRAYYADPIDAFLERNQDEVLGILAQGEAFAIDASQRDAWLEEIEILRGVMRSYQGRGKLYFEYAVPRMGRRIDVLAIIDHVLFVIEFKVGEREFTASANDQVLDYALDLKNFHETSHSITVAPILVATRAKSRPITIATTPHHDGVLVPIHAARSDLGAAIDHVLAFADGPRVDPDRWEAGRYRPTPTIIEAATALYAGHSVEDISRSDASAINLSRTSNTISRIIAESRTHSCKSICFVTGVPGSGKTLVGLDIATRHIDKTSELYSVFLSGNAPLVAILREALARDKVARARLQGQPTRKGAALSEVKLFIQNVHHFRDDCLIDPPQPPVEHVVLFDEAQRAWNREQTESFMRRRKRRADFSQSEPEFLISCMDRHQDWATVVCLVGGGQEINTGEAGIVEWIDSIVRAFPRWHIHISPQLHDSEYGAGRVLESLRGRPNVHLDEDLHLAVSMRSFRAEMVSAFVKALLDRQEQQARSLYAQISRRYPIVLSRSLHRAKAWLRESARGSERYGIIVSSKAQRLKPHAIDVRSPTDPIHWFLGPKDDVRSSYYLEDVATEFQVQGLELDWAGVVWDGDFRASGAGWEHFSFVGDRWNRVRDLTRQVFLKNAYRVLLTRARQGMVIVVPEGDPVDPTRRAEYYDPTFSYLRRIGLELV